MVKDVLLATSIVVVFASICAAAPKEPVQAPTNAEAFDKIVETLKAEAEAFTKAKDDKGPQLSPAVKRLQYSPESAQPLVKALQGRNGKPLVELYVAYQLLQPLKMAGNETIRPTKPTLLKLLTLRCQYKPMPRWGRAMLTGLNPPPDMPADKLTKYMEKVHELRAQKGEAERPVIKHNRTVRGLESTIKRLLAMLADASADEALLKRLAQEEQGKLMTYGDTLAAIKAEVENMKKDRAKKIYEKLKALAFRVGTKKHYIDPTRPRYSLTGNSGFHAEPLYFAVATMQVVNLVATPAREPAVPIPDVKKWEAEQRKRRERNR